VGYAYAYGFVVLAEGLDMFRLAQKGEAIYMLSEFI
jgi:hypothetical protein